MRRTAAAIVLVAAALAAAPTPAQPPAAGTEDLAVGPFRAVLTPGLKEKYPTRREVEVQFVHRDKLVFRELKEVPAGAGKKQLVPDGEVKVHEVGQVSSVEMVVPPGAKAVLWTADKNKNQFAGPTVPKPPQDFATKAIEAKDLAVYLVVRAEYLYRSLDAALVVQDGNRAAGLLAQADGFAKIAAGLNGIPQGVPEAVAGVYRLHAYAARQSGLVLEQRKALRALAEIKLDADKARELAAAESAARTKFGQGLVFGGGLVVLADDAGPARGARVAQTGFREMAAAAVDHAVDRARIEAVEKAFSGVELDRLKAAREAFEKTRDDLGRELEAAAAKAGVAGAVPRVGERADQFTPAAARLALRRRADAVAGTGRPHPLLETGVARLRAAELTAAADGAKKGAADAADGAKRADEVFALATALAGRVGDVPPGPEFDPDRAWVATTVADLAHQAVAHRHGFRAWSKAWDPRADFGLRAADWALGKYAHLDTARAARAARAWLLLQRGETAAAERQADEVAPLRPWDPATQYNAARVYGITERGLPKTAKYAAALDAALAVGHHDVASAKNDVDTGLVLAINPPLKAALVKLDLDAVAESFPDVAGAQRFDIWVTNKSGYALKEATLTLKANVRVAGGQWAPRTKTVTLGYLPDGQRYLWVGAATGLELSPAAQVVASSRFLSDDNNMGKGFAFPVVQARVDYGPPQLRFGF